MGSPRAWGFVTSRSCSEALGFSSPPAWLRPFHLLSNGEQFRVTLARALAEMPELAVVDEFTSVVDRTVARIGSGAISRAVRRSGRRLVAVTCHYDVLPWLEPDWVLDMADGSSSVRREDVSRPSTTANRPGNRALPFVGVETIQPSSLSERQASSRIAMLRRIGRGPAGRVRGGAAVSASDAFGLAGASVRLPAGFSGNRHRQCDQRIRRVAVRSPRESHTRA